MSDLLKSIENDIKVYKEAIKETAETIVQDEVSNFPIFIAYEYEFPVGEKILDKDDFQTSWNINASCAEDLIKQGIIPMEKAKFFITQYKPYKEFICLFIVKEEESKFVFIPY